MSSTKVDGDRQTTTYKDSYGHIMGTSETRTVGRKSQTTYKDRYGHIVGKSTK